MVIPSKTLRLFDLETPDAIILHLAKRHHEARGANYRCVRNAGKDRRMKPSTNAGAPLWSAVLLARSDVSGCKGTASCRPANSL